MQPTPIPANDAERVVVLRSLGILDTPPEPDYDEITQLAAQICGTPIALVTLVDAERQWFKSRVGITGTEGPRETSFCAHVICEPDKELFVVPDAQQDPRFIDHPAVLEAPNVRFYAGAPLVTHDGWALGTLCVADRKPRELTPGQLNALTILKRHVVNALELRRLVEAQKEMISALERTQRELKEARRVAEEATRAKAEFLAAMSHEIRTPMNAVIGMTTLLEATALDADQRDSVATIRQSGDHLLTVINDILDFSKIEAERLEIEYAPFDLAECIRSAVNLLANRAREKAIALRIETATGVPAIVSADATRLRQIVVNLVSNAVKFTDKGEVVVQVAGRALLDGRYELEIAVRDTGIGIPAERIGKLFHRFSQVDISTTRRYGGTGLGLAISHRLAALHGGRMWVESEPGKGSCFRFTLTARTAGAAPAPPTARDPAEQFDPGFAGRHPARILVADDNPVNQKVLSRMLQKLGYAPEVVSNGQEAFGAVQARPFDLVFMDIEMPVLDGPGAAALIRKEIASDRQPMIVAVTAHAMAGSREAFLQAGMDDYLAKPIRLPELIAALARSTEPPRK